MGPNSEPLPVGSGEGPEALQRPQLGTSPTSCPPVLLMNTIVLADAAGNPLLQAPPMPQVPNTSLFWGF